MAKLSNVSTGCPGDQFFPATAWLAKRVRASVCRIRLLPDGRGSIKMQGLATGLLLGVLLSGAARADGPAVPNAPVAKPVSVDLTPETVFQTLTADIAAQRGIWSVAAPLYLRLAKQTADPEFARNAIEAGLYDRQPEIARAGADVWLGEEPTSTDALHAVIALNLASKNPVDALPYLKRLLAEPGVKPDAEFMRLSAMLSGQPDKEQSLLLVQKLAAGYPDLPEAHLVLAQASARAGHFDQALTELDATDHLRPDWELSAGLRFDVLAHTDPEKADAFATSWLSAHEHADQVRLTYARWLVARNRPADARAQFSRLVADLPDNPNMQLALGFIDLQLKDLDAASAAFQRARALGYPDQGLVELYLGQIAEAQKQYDDASRWYRSVPPGPQYLQAQIRYASMLSGQGKPEQALAWLQGVKVSSDADQVELIRAQALLLRDEHHVSQAYDLLGNALQARPDSVDLLYDHALLAESLGHLDVLEHDLRHILIIQPDHAQALNALGYTYADHNIRLDEATGLLGRALKLDPDDAFILDSMGWLQYRKGNLSAAEQYISRAWNLSHDPEIAAHLGEVLWKEGKLDAVHALWKEAVPANPDNAVLRSAADRFR